MTVVVVLGFGVKNGGVGDVKQPQIFQQSQAVGGHVLRGQVECGLLVIVIVVRHDIQHVRREDVTIVRVVLLVVVVHANLYDRQAVSGG